MITDSNRARLGGMHVAKNLGRLAIKAFSKDDVRRDRFRPPIAIDPPCTVYVTHFDEKDIYRQNTVLRKPPVSPVTLDRFLVRRFDRVLTRLFDLRRES